MTGLSSTDQAKPTSLDMANDPRHNQSSALIDGEKDRQISFEDVEMTQNGCEAETDVYTLEDLVEDILNLVATYEGTVHNLRYKIEKLEAERDELIGQVRSLQTSNGILQKERDCQMGLLMKLLQAQISTLQTEQGDYKGGATEAIMEVAPSSMQNMASDLRHNQSSALVDVNQLISFQDVKTAEHGYDAEEDAIIEAISKAIKDLSDGFQRFKQFLRGVIETLRSECDELKQQVRSLKTRNGILQKERLGLTRQLIKLLLTQNKNFQADRNDFMGQVQVLQAQNAALQTERDNSNRLVRSLRSQIGALQAEQNGYKGEASKALLETALASMHNMVSEDEERVKKRVKTEN